MAKKELVLCDSNIIIDIINGNHSIQKELIKLNPRNVFISVITEMEVLIGALNKEMLAKFSKKLKKYNIIQLNTESSIIASALVKKYHLSHGLDIPDAMIAATAIANGLVLFTSNVKDFKYIPNLKLYHS